MPPSTLCVKRRGRWFMHQKAHWWHNSSCNIHWYILEWYCLLCIGGKSCFLSQNDCDAGGRCLYVAVHSIALSLMPSKSKAYWQSVFLFGGKITPYLPMDILNLFLWWFSKAVEWSFYKNGKCKRTVGWKEKDVSMFRHQWHPTERYIHLCCDIRSWRLVWSFEYSVRGLASQSSNCQAWACIKAIACMLHHSHGTSYCSSVII